MATLYHHPLCAQSRFIRLVLAEMGMEVSFEEERTWERRREFLIMNPAGTTPVLDDGGIIVPGAGNIAEYLDETRGLGLGNQRLMPEDVGHRVEVRRLLDWFNAKFFTEISDPLVTEKVFKRFMRSEDGGGAPDMNIIRAARTNVRYHLQYISWLTASRNWLAGPNLTYVDLAAAAQLSCVDYLGDVPWSDEAAAHAWYARIKSRPSFRTILGDRIPGMAPSAHYADLDF